GVAPLELKPIRSVRTKQAFLPGLEGQAGAVSVVTALDAQVVDLLGQVEDVVALDVEVVERVQPLAAGVEMDDRALVRTLADLGVPGAQPGALVAGPRGDGVLVQAAGVIGDLGGQPVVAGDRAPAAPVADAFAVVDLEHLAG